MKWSEKGMITELRVGLEPCFPMCAGEEINPHLLVIPLLLLEMASIGPSYQFLEPSDLPIWLSNHNCVLGQLLLGDLGELEHC